MNAYGGELDALAEALGLEDRVPVTPRARIVPGNAHSKSASPARASAATMKVMPEPRYSEACLV